MWSYLLLLIINLSLFTTIIGTNRNNGTCGCYMLGTISNIEEMSICDEVTLKCKCHPNVIGHNCDKCADGFYNIFSGKGCSSCLCDPIGSTKDSCNLLTGQCYCKPGFTGYRCDQCEPFTYRISSDICDSCNCNLFGSTNQHCNSNGQCSCLENVTGRACDKCKENTHNVTMGCISCPPCYTSVQNSKNNFIKYLNKIEFALSGMENNLFEYIQEYKYFVNEIKLLKAKIQKLLVEYKEINTTMVSETVITNLVQEANGFRLDVLNLLQRVPKKFNFKELKSYITKAGTDLAQSNKLLYACKVALENATRVSKSILRYNKTMTTYAIDSLKLTEQIEKEADELNGIALIVNSSCSSSCEAAQVFENKHKRIKVEIEDLRKGVIKTKTALETTRNHSTRFHEQIKTSSSTAFLLLDKTNSMEVPDINYISDRLSGFDNNFDVINKKVKKLSERSGKITNNKIGASKTLEGFKGKQTQINEQFIMIKTYEARADKALADIKSSIKSSNQSLENVKEIKIIKQLAYESMKKVPRIREQVDAVTKNAEHVKNIFRKVSVLVKQIDEMQSNLTDTIELDKSNRITLTENIKLIENLEKQESDVSQKLQDYHGKLKSIRDKLKSLKEQQHVIENDIKRFQEYIHVINTVPTTKEQLDEVESDILTLEETTSTIDNLRKIKDDLQQQVRNVKSILESIPDDDPNLCESAKNEPKGIE